MGSPLESSVDSESLCLCKEVQLKVLKMPLGAKDKEKVNFTFGIYDFDGSGKMDAFWIADALRALGLNPTNAQAEALGSLKQKKQKTVTQAEFEDIYDKQLHDKDQGCYDDYMEVLRLYDKQEDGTLPFAELRHVLLAIGENFTDAPVLDAFLLETFDEEDDEGFVPYQPFLKKLIAGPFAEK